jgi:hypothetical protein
LPQRRSRSPFRLTPVLADATSDGIAKYREALADGNPGRTVGNARRGIVEGSARPEEGDAGESVTSARDRAS